MAMYDQSIVDTIKSAIGDAQELVRGEIALAKAELRAEVRTMAAAALLLCGAAVMALIGLVFLCSTIAWGISEGAGWPVWAGMGIVTAVVLIAAALLAMAGRRSFARQRHMPLTTETMKENATWMQRRTS